MRQFPRILSTFALAVCLAFASHPELGLAEIYQWTDSSGKIHYSDKPHPSQQATTVQLDSINTFTEVSVTDAPDWQGFYQPETKNRVKNVVLYSTENCGYCKKARRYFESKQIAFKEKKIDSDPAAFEEYKQLQATGVPVIFVGRKRMNGFNQSAFDQLFYGEKS